MGIPILCIDGDWGGLVLKNCWEFLCLLNHTLDLAYGWNAVAEVLCFVGLYELGVEILWHAMLEFLYCVDACCLKEFCKLTCDAVDTEKVYCLYLVSDIRLGCLL